MAHAPQDREVRFADLYRQTRDEVMAYLVRRTRSMEDAADALSETYAVAWRKLDSLPEGDRARLWLFGAARIELRKAAREGRAEDELITELAGELQAAHGEQIRSADADESLWLALAGLSERDREIVTLTAWEGLAPREIAAILGLSPNLVRIRLHRARRDLRTQLDPEGKSKAPPTASRTSQV